MEATSPVDYTKPVIYADPAVLEDVVRGFQRNKFHNIVVVCGAGLSTSAGIPDFRSADGLYSRLGAYNLPFPEAMFTMSYYRYRPEAFQTLMKWIWSDARFESKIKYFPTLGHAFLRLLSERKSVLRIFTQNFDGFEHLSGVPQSVITECHGHLRTSHCAGPCQCHRAISTAATRAAIDDRAGPVDGVWDYSRERGRLSRARDAGCTASAANDVVDHDLGAQSSTYSDCVSRCSNCGSPIKPDIVFFEENLPTEFDTFKKNAVVADLLIVIGSSMQVEPVNTLPDLLRGVPRILINREPVGEFTRTLATTPPVCLNSLSKETISRCDADAVARLTGTPLGRALTGSVARPVSHTHPGMPRDIFISGNADQAVELLSALIGNHDQLDKLYQSILRDLSAIAPPIPRRHPLDPTPAILPTHAINAINARTAHMDTIASATAALVREHGFAIAVALPEHLLPAESSALDLEASVVVDGQSRPVTLLGTAVALTPSQLARLAYCGEPEISVYPWSREDLPFHRLGLGTEQADKIHPDLTPALTELWQAAPLQPPMDEQTDTMAVPVVDGSCKDWREAMGLWKGELSGLMMRTVNVECNIVYIMLNYIAGKDSEFPSKAIFDKVTTAIGVTEDHPLWGSFASFKQKYDEQTYDNAGNIILLAEFAQQSRDYLLLRHGVLPPDSTAPEPYATIYNTAKFLAYLLDMLDVMRRDINKIVPGFEAVNDLIDKYDLRTDNEYSVMLQIPVIARAPSGLFTDYLHRQRIANERRELDFQATAYLPAAGARAHCWPHPDDVDKRDYRPAFGHWATMCFGYTQANPDAIDDDFGSADSDEDTGSGDFVRIMQERESRMNSPTNDSPEPESEPEGETAPVTVSVSSSSESEADSFLDGKVASTSSGEEEEVEIGIEVAITASGESEEISAQFGDDDDDDDDADFVPGSFSEASDFDTSSIPTFKVSPEVNSRCGFVFTTHLGIDFAANAEQLVAEPAHALKNVKTSEPKLRIMFCPSNTTPSLWTSGAYTLLRSEISATLRTILGVDVRCEVHTCLAHTLLYVKIDWIDSIFDYPVVSTPNWHRRGVVHASAQNLASSELIALYTVTRILTSTSTPFVSNVLERTSWAVPDTSKIMMILSKRSSISKACAAATKKGLTGDGFVSYFKEHVRVASIIGDIFVNTDAPFSFIGRRNDMSASSIYALPELPVPLQTIPRLIASPADYLSPNLRTDVVSIAANLLDNPFTSVFVPQHVARVPRQSAVNADSVIRFNQTVANPNFYERMAHTHNEEVDAVLTAMNTRLDNDRTAATNFRNRVMNVSHMCAVNQPTFDSRGTMFNVTQHPDALARQGMVLLQRSDVISTLSALRDISSHMLDMMAQEFRDDFTQIMLHTSEDAWAASSTNLLTSIQSTLQIPRLRPARPSRLESAEFMITNTSQQMAQKKQQ